MEVKDGCLRTGRPLQIIEFENRNGRKYLVLNEENLQNVLTSAGDIPVSLVSITGASRQGKSFLLSFMIRYLEALLIDETDWMGWDNAKKALEGFTWRDGIDPETSGMWLWSQPFVVHSNGKQLAIILMDTQGTFDKNTTQREWATIVGLSLLTSSCMIFNCIHSFQEDALIALESYIEYGKQAMEQDNMEDVQPFQKLVFLIRDWSSPSSFQYGAKGGELYLKEKLKIEKEMPEPVKRIRETLTSCFEAIECFLMPDPGEKAKQKGFNGSISLLSPNFAKKLEAFVSQLLNPEEIPVKTVLGHKITGKDLVGYYKNYVEIFNGDEIPTPMGVFEATARILNEKLVQKSKAVYVNFMRKKLMEKSFLSEKNFKTTHKNSEKKSKDSFKQARKVGGSEFVEIYKNMLGTAILEEFESFKIMNTNKMEKEINQAKERAIENYREKMNNELTDEVFYEEKKFKGMSSTYTEEVVDEFQEMLEEVEDVETYIEELTKKLEPEQTMYVLLNTTRKNQAENFMKNLVNEIVNDYSEGFEEKAKENEALTENDLQEIHEQMKTKSLADYKTHEKRGNKDFVAHYNKILEEQLETKRNIMVVTITKEQEHKRLKCENLISDLASVFKEKMIEQVDCAESEEALQEKHIELRAEILDEFHKKQEYKSENEYFVNFRDSLKTKLSVSFENDILEKFKVKAQKSESSFTEAYDAAVVEYKREMENSIKSKEFFTDDELNTFHLNYFTIATELYKSSPKLGVNIEEKEEQMIGKLKTELQELYENIKIQNDVKKSNTEQKCINDVTECLKEYTITMRSSFENARDEKKLNEMHLEALQNAKHSFENKFPSKADNVMLDKFIAELKTQILEAYEEFLEFYKLKMEEQTGGTKKAIENGKKFYHEEMAKHYSNTSFMRPATLEKIHKEVSQKTVERCCQSGALTEIQKQDLMASLQITFNQYEELNNMNVPVDPAIGIDLGTTYSCVAVYHKGKVEVIPNKIGKKTTPSYVAFKDGVMIVGDAAKNQAHENPENTIFDAKRIIGRLMNDEKLQKDITTWPFKVVEEGGVPKIMAEGNTYYPEKISSEILKEMRSIAETYLGGIKIKKAVITVPAYFTDGQRQATIDAGELAGLEVLKIIDEPTAAAVAYKIQNMDDETRNVLIFDLGGGTFDVAVLEMRKGVIEVKSVDGDTHLGGEDFDNNLVEHCALEFQHQNGIDILDGRDSTRHDVRTNTLRTMRRVRNESEKRKIDLSSSKRVDVSVDTVHRDMDLRVTCTRDDFEKMNQHLFDKTIEIAEKVLKSAGKTKDEIDDIVLVGGSTRIPKVQELLKKFFNGKALNIQIDPDEAVARGAAYQAAILNGKITKDSTDFNDILEVTPFSMGVEVYGGDFSIIIPKNNRIPCTIEEIYRTAHNNQTSVQIVVFQGENSIANKNTKLGEFYLNGVPPALAGKEEIKVKMTINDQGVLNVTAVCTSNNVTNKGLIVNEQKWRLTKETIQKLLAEDNSAAGSQRRLSFGD